MSKYFTFTGNNWTPEAEEWLMEKFVKKCDYLIFGHETAPNTGTPHLQGYFCLNKANKTDNLKVTFTRHGLWIGKPVTDPYKPPSYWKGYCSKQDEYPFEAGVLPSDEQYQADVENKKTRQGKRSDLERVRDAIKDGMTNLRELRDKFPGVMARCGDFVQQLIIDNRSPEDVSWFKCAPWHEELLKKLEEEPSHREILWYYDLKGMKGKSSFCTYMESTYHPEVQIMKPGRHQDMAYELREDIAILIIDCPRSRFEYLQYHFLEDVKDRRITQAKYKTFQKRLSKAVHLVVFSNAPPTPEMLSEDRLVVTEIKS